MDNINIALNNTFRYVKEKFANDSSGHDWYHTERVYNMAILLAKGKHINSFIVQMAALLHDVEDWKFNDGNGQESKVVKNWLESQNVDNESIKEICNIIEKLSFKGAKVPTPMNTLEGKIVQDADRLDAIGAIGITRAFAYGGSKQRKLHDPDIKPIMHNSFENYKSNQSTTINHFYEKLILLKDQMNTEEAKKIAEKRHSFMLTFLEHFFAEWEGER
jgi:uncharacterized protein